MAVVDFPEPPFSLPRTMTCADTGAPTSACINMDTQPQRSDPFSGLQRVTSRYSIIHDKLIINYIASANARDVCLASHAMSKKNSRSKQRPRVVRSLPTLRKAVGQWRTQGERIA